MLSELKEKYPELVFSGFDQIFFFVSVIQTPCMPKPSAMRSSLSFHVCVRTSTVPLCLHPPPELGSKRTAAWLDVRFRRECRQFRFHCFRSLMYCSLSHTPTSTVGENVGQLERVLQRVTVIIIDR